MTPAILTHTARVFDFARPLPSMVCIEDIAHHLALTNRFTGATVRPYSVAEHSLLVAEILERNVPAINPNVLRAALLHDAHEAYTGDQSTPSKRFLGDAWHNMERAVVHAIEMHFGIEDVARNHRFIVKHADLVALATEKRDLMPAHSDPWPILRDVKPVDWIDLRDREGMDWDDWKLAFLARHDELAAACEAYAR